MSQDPIRIRIHTTVNFFSFFKFFCHIWSPDILSLDPLYDLLHVLGDAALAQQFGRLFSKNKHKKSVLRKWVWYSVLFLASGSGIRDEKNLIQDKTISDPQHWKKSNETGNKLSGKSKFKDA